MHSEVLKHIPDGVTSVDHIRGENTLDNRKSNLRLANHSQQARNAPCHADKVVPVKGIYQRPNGKWQAKVMHMGMRIHIGTFDCMQEAKEAHVRAVQAIHGDFARH